MQVLGIGLHPMETQHSSCLWNSIFFNYSRHPEPSNTLHTCFSPFANLIPFCLVSGPWDQPRDSVGSFLSVLAPQSPSPVSLTVFTADDHSLLLRQAIKRHPLLQHGETSCNRHWAMATPPRLLPVQTQTLSLVI